MHRGERAASNVCSRELSPIHRTATLAAQVRASSRHDLRRNRRMPASATDSGGSSKLWSTPIRVLLSVLIVWHFVAVILGPLSLPPSILASALQPIFRPYIRATY